MTLDYSIDRATFRSLVDAAMRRIPTASRGNWTLHAPVDPGITLLELFAWLLEQRSFWADQSTSPLVEAVLALLGERMHTARAAGVPITFSPEAAPDPVRQYAPHALISPRTPMRVPDTDLVFTTRQGMLALSVARYTTAPRSPVIHVAGDIAPSAEENLRSGRPIDILASNGGAASVELGFVLTDPPPAGGATQPVSIAFELDTTVQPAWSPDAVTVRPPAALRWEYKTTAGTWIALPQLRDGTLSLRRSGTVRFALPADWSAYNADRVGWIRIATAAATFAAAPTVIAILPNTVTATHVQWKVSASNPSWLPLPGREVQLDPGALPLEDHTHVYVTETDGRHRYRVVPDFTTAGPGDRVVVVDRARARVRFGDGLNGKVPRLAPSAPIQVSVVYAAGGGDAGNVAPCAWEALQGPLPDALSWVEARGGSDDETIDDARLRVGAGLLTPTRAVNPDDHVRIAIGTPGVAVARAHAEPGFQRGECGVVPGVTTVFVVPGVHSRTRDTVRAATAVAAPVADPGLLDEVRAQFAKTRLVGELVFVESAAYRHVQLRATVTGAPHDPEGLRKRLEAALRLYLDPLLGGDDAIGWPFGEPVRPTALLGVAQREVGDRGAVVEVAIAIDGKPFESCEDVAIRSFELIAVDGIDVVIEPTPAGDVGLR